MHGHAKRACPSLCFVGVDSRTRAAAGVLVLVLAALVAAAYDGTAWSGHRPLSSSTSTGEQPGQPEQPDGTTIGTPSPPGQHQPWTLPTWIRTAVAGAVAVVAGALLLTILFSLRFVILRRRLKGDAPLRGDAVAPPSVELVDSADVEAAIAQTLAGLDEGSPRNAVVACWVRLEELAAARGLERRPADTPAEFVSRALGTYRLDPAALQRLAELYREARFSRHTIGEQHRDEARGCLERLGQGIAA